MSLDMTLDHWRATDEFQNEDAMGRTSEAKTRRVPRDLSERTLQGCPGLPPACTELGQVHSPGLLSPLCWGTLPAYSGLPLQISFEQEICIQNNK